MIFHNYGNLRRCFFSSLNFVNYKFVNINNLGYVIKRTS